MKNKYKNNDVDVSAALSLCELMAYNIDIFITTLPTIRNNKKLLKKAMDISEKMGELYQEVGELMSED